MSEMKIVGVLLSDEVRHRAKQVADTYNLPVLESSTSAQYAIVVRSSRLQLIDLHQPRFRPVFVDVKSVARLGKRNLLGRAIGSKTINVIDATGGLGNDAMLMARMGYRVTVIERSPAIAAILADGISIFNRQTSGCKIHFVHGDAKKLLPELSNSPCSVFIDPMYPEEGRKQSVGVSRKRTVIRDIVGNDTDARELFEIAMLSNAPRVVVKRPNYATPMKPELISHSVNGKMVRYDVYFTPATSKSKSAQVP